MRSTYGSVTDKPVTLGFLIELELKSVVFFFWKEENRNIRKKKPRVKDENQQQSQSTYDGDSGNGTRAALVGGECSRHCAIPTHKIK